MMRQWTGLIRLLVAFAGCLGSAWGYYPGGPLQSEAFGNVFTTADKPEFTLTKKAAGNFSPCSFQVKDFFGKLILSGKWDGGSPLKFDSLGMGYYTVELSREGNVLDRVAFSVVSDPETRSGNNGFFCIDTAHSWIGRTPPVDGKDSFREAARLARLMGAASSRDRLGWAEVAPAPEEIDWKQYILCPQYMREEGVEVLGMFHDAPEYVKKTTRSVPDDLFELYRFCNRLGTDFSGSVQAWEFWNEQNATWFNWDAVWEMATAHKVAYLALKKANPELTVLPGGLTEWIVPAPEYFDFLMANGLYDYFDAMAFHLYGPLNSYSHFVDDLNAVYAKYGRKPKPLWITESGTHAEGSALEEPLYPRDGKYDFPIQAAALGNREHSVGQEQVWAEFIVKSAVRMQMLGIARNYPFVFLPFNEQGGGKAWGYFRWDYSVKPVFQANANLIEQIGSAELLGELQMPGAIKACLYQQKDGRETIVFWNAKGAVDEHPDSFRYTAESLAEYVRYTGETPVEFPVADGDYQLVDLMGRSEIVHAEAGKLKVTGSKFPAYINGLSGLKADRPAASPGTGEPSQIDETIVLKLNVPDRSKICNERFLFLQRGDQFTVEVYNFSDRPRRGKLRSGSSIRLDFSEKELTIPAMGRTVLSMTCRDIVNPTRNIALVIAGEFDGREISPLAAPVIPIDFMERFYRVETISPARFSEASSGKVTKSEKKGVVRFDVDFSGVDDAWLYPVIELSKTEGAGKLSAISFDIRAEQREGSGYLYAFVIPGDEAGGDWKLEYAAPTETWRKVFLQVDRSVPEHARLRLDKIRRIAIGLNPKAKKQTVEIRNLRLYFEKK